MLILGIDPGLTRCGAGIIKSDNRQIEFVTADLFTTKPTESLDARLNKIGNNIKDIIKKYKPDVIVCEKVFAQENRASIIGTAQVTGLVIYLGTESKIQVATHTPTEIKAAITGNGRANKKQIKYMVKKILRLNKLPEPADLADSLAVAICHAWNPVDISASNTASKTPAQQAWIEALKKTRKSGYFNR